MNENVKLLKIKYMLEGKKIRHLCFACRYRNVEERKFCAKRRSWMITDDGFITDCENFEEYNGPSKEVIA